MGYISVQPKNILGIDSEMFTVRKYVTPDKLKISVIKDNVLGTSHNKAYTTARKNGISAITAIWDALMERPYIPEF